MIKEKIGFERQISIDHTIVDGTYNKLMD